MNIVLFILLYFTLYFLIIRILKNIRLRFEKLEELEGEFIFTYLRKLQKKENIILFFKSCKENKPELYDKFLKNAPMGINISAIMDREIENYKNKWKGSK